MPQLVFPAAFPQRAGSLVKGPYDAESYLAESAIRMGLLVAFGTDRQRQVEALPVLPVADPNAIMTVAQLASVVAGVTYETAAEFDGAIGHDKITPARTLTVTFDAVNVNDWDGPGGETLIEIYGLDADGNEIKDSIARPNGAAAAAYTTALPFSAVTRVDVSTCAGNGGTADLGVSNDRVAIGRSYSPGIAMYDPMSEPFAAVTEIETLDQVSVLTAGKIWAVTEAAVTDGDDVYVRVLLAGLNVRGQFTGQDGAALPGVYAHLANAKWRSSADAAGLAILELKG